PPYFVRSSKAQTLTRHLRLLHHRRQLQPPPNIGRNAVSNALNLAAFFSCYQQRRLRFAT
ncbi:hypothetical protein S245_043293, partial [Arachis hypogaea]